MEVTTRAEARARGLKHYFTGKPCPKGHVGLRYTSSSGCADCLPKGEERRKKLRKDYAENKDTRLAAMKVYRQRNAERLSEKAAAYRKENASHLAASQAAWARDNRKHKSELGKTWRHANPSKDRERRYNHSRRARKLLNGGDLSLGIVDVLWTAQRGRCACPCRADLRLGSHLDHIVALSKGGANVDGNVQLLTPACNLSKGTKDNAIFMAQQKAKYDANT